MKCEVLVDDQPFATFEYVDGFSGERRLHAGRSGPFLVFGNGRLSGPLRDATGQMLARGAASPLGATALSFVSAADARRLPNDVWLGPCTVDDALGWTEDGCVEELVVRAADFSPAPGHALSVWGEWLHSPPASPARWRGASLPWKRAMLFVSRFASAATTELRVLPRRIELDGCFVRGVPDLFLMLGEAFDGIGGYVGETLDGLADRLLDYAQAPGGTTIVWRGRDAARQHAGPEAWRWELARTGRASRPDTDLVTAVDQLLDERGFKIEEFGDVMASD